MTQQEVANAAGLNRNSVQQAETGTDTRYSTIYKIAAALDMTVSELLRYGEAA